MNRQVLILIIVSVVAVVALFGLTVWSQQSGTGTSSQADPVANTQSGASDERVTAPVAPPLAPEVAAQAQALEDEIAATDDESLVLAKRRELVELYAGAGRLERAGDAQEELAATLNTAEAWAHAGNLHFDWMEQQPDGTDKIEAARQAIDAYTRALELDPDNLDVRTDRAVAYLNDPENPMRAIQETNLVLEADPSHPQANFNRGVMLTLIGRYEDAIAQYQRVQEITEPGSRVHEEARRREDQLVRATAQPQGQ